MVKKYAKQLKLFALIAKIDSYASQFDVQAIANLSVNANVAKAVAEEGGISVLAILAKSMNRLAAEEAAGGLWNLSVGEEHKVVDQVHSHFYCLLSNLLPPKQRANTGCHC